MPNKFPSTNCFVITYIYVDARIYRFSPCTFLVIVIEKMFDPSATSLFLFLFSLRVFAHFQITLFPHVFLLILRYLRDVERRSEESEESEESEKRKSTRLLRIESNRIESCRVSRSGERNEEEKESVRFLHAFLSEGGKYAKEHRGRCIPGRKEGALFAKSNNRDALSNVTGTTREHFFPANERNMARLEVRI